MIVWMKLSSRLLGVLVLLNLARECLTSGDDPSAAQAIDPNSASSTQSKSRFAGVKQTLAQWKGKLFNSSKKNPTADPSVKSDETNENLDEETTYHPAPKTAVKPVEEETDTLKFAKLALQTLQVLMDNKIFDNCANPWSKRINNFDVRQHIFTRKPIKMNPYDETFMNVYHNFLYECCHPLFALYEKRLVEDKELAEKKGNRLYNAEETSYLVHQHQVFSPQANPPSVLNPPPPKLGPQTSHIDENGPSRIPNHQVTSPPRTRNRVTFADPHVTGHISPLDKTPRKAEVPYSQRAKWMPKTPTSQRRGPFQPRALTYSQKSIIYRVIKWASSFLIEPRYIPANKLKRKLDEISLNYGMNLLDPKYDNLQPSIITHDCIPHKPTDMEHCCEEKDKTIEYLYHISDIYVTSKQRKKKEKRERKQKEEDEEQEREPKEKKQKQTYNKSRSKTAKFRDVKWPKCVEKYGFYPQETNKKLALEMVDAFRPKKFEEIFHMKPKEAKKIIKQRYLIRKYQEAARRFGLVLVLGKRSSETANYTNVIAGFAPISGEEVETNPHFIKDPAKCREAFAELDMVPHTAEAPPGETATANDAKSETAFQKYFVMPFCTLKNIIIGVLTRGSESTNQNQSTASSEHPEDEHSQSPHNTPVHPHEPSQTQNHETE